MAGISHTSTVPAFEKPQRPRRRFRLVPRFLRFHDGDIDRTRVERTRKDWLVDVHTTLWVFGVGLAIHYENVTSGRGGIEPTAPLAIFDLVMMVVASVLLFWRRRFPYAIAIVIALTCVASPSAALASLVATFALAAYAPQGRAWVGLAVMLATVPITALIWPDLGNDSDGFWTDVVFGVIATACVFAWGLFAAARRQLLLSLEDRATRAETEQQLRVDQARQQERNRIAREMHDVLAHRMSLLSVHAGALEFRPDAPPEDIARAAGVIRATAHEALEELRAVIGVLRVAETVDGVATAEAAASGGDTEWADARAPEPPQPTLADVPHLVDEWRSAGARITLIDGDIFTTDVPVTVSRTAYRIVQESLTNAGKHAPSAKVDIILGGHPGESLTISVTNPLSVSGGASSVQAAIPGTGLGLVGLRERVELVGGGFAAGVDPELVRFVVEARLPWSAAA